MYIIQSRETNTPRYLHKHEDGSYYWMSYSHGALEFGTIAGAKEMIKSYNWSAKPVKK